MNRLSRIKTTYNDEAKYDRQLYFEEQRKVYQRQINIATNIDAITEKHFSLKPLQIGFMQSTALKDEPKFKEVKKIMMEYNKNVLESGEHAVNGLHLKTVVMDSMIKFMRMMMLAPDTATRKTILQIAYHWFMHHLDPKSGKKSQIELQKEIKKILIVKSLLPIDIINKQLLIRRVEESLHPYKIRARTQYREIDDPSIQLENYHTHKLEFSTDHQNKETKENRKWIDTVKFPKIDLPAYYFDEQPQPPPQDESKAKIDPPLGEQLEGKPVEPLQQQQAKIEVQQQQNPDLDFGGEPDNEPEEQEEIIEEKKRGKLDPLLKQFLLERVRSKEKEEVRGEQAVIHKFNKKNIIQEEDANSIAYMREWAMKRARIKTQFNAKNQSMRGVDKVPRGKMTENSLNFVENDIDRLKVNRTLDEHYKNIGALQIPPDKLNSEAGTSLYDRRRVKTEASHKPFSSMLQDYSRKAQEQRALDQIIEIKSKMAKHHLYAPLDSFIKGLAPPQEDQTEDSDAKERKVVWPNCQMFSNPFIKVAKKKKKKKKKK